MLDWSAPYRGRRVLVLGASGFMGRWVARGLTAVGADLWLSGRDLPSLQAVCDTYEIQGRFLESDLAEKGAFAKLYQQSQPDVTFNLVGYGVDPSERVDSLASRLNELLVAEIAEIISLDRNRNWLGLRLVHVGSGAEYGSLPGPLTENLAPAPLSPYGQTKLAGTRALASISERTGLRAVTARLFTVYGPGEHAGRLLPCVIDAARSGVPLRLTRGDQERDFTYVGDVAEGLLRLGSLEGPVPSVLNLATGVLTSVRDFAACAAELLRVRPDQLQFGALSTRPDELRHGPVDLHLLRKVLGWVPASTVRTGVGLTIAFASCGAKRDKANPQPRDERSGGCVRGGGSPK